MLSQHHLAAELNSRCDDDNDSKGFKDHFSNVSNLYKDARPTYPDAIFEWIRDHAPGTSLAVDVGTGAGEAALSLSKFFDRVIATDASSAQISRCNGPENVKFCVAPAEQCPVDSGSADVVIAAQAVHWFDHSRFWPECLRILKPFGLTVLLSYHLLRFEDPEIESGVWAAAKSTFLDYRPPEIKHVLSRYQTLPGPFPGDEVWSGDVPVKFISREWDFHEVILYFSSWSAIGAYKKAHEGRDPIPEFAEMVKKVWGHDLDLKRQCKWDLTLRAFMKGRL